MSWPEWLTYSRESILQVSFLREYLRGAGEGYESVVENRAVHPHVQVRKIVAPHPLAGLRTVGGRENFGLFAVGKIGCGEAIGEYVGEMSMVSAGEVLAAESSEYVWMVSAGGLFFRIDARRVANELALVNDYRGLGAGPNVKMATIGHRGFYHFGYVAVRDIEEGDELLADYGELFGNRFCSRDGRHDPDAITGKIVP